MTCWDIFNSSITCKLNFLMSAITNCYRFAVQLNCKHIFIRSSQNSGWGVFHIYLCEMKSCVNDWNFNFQFKLQLPFGLKI